MEHAVIVHFRLHGGDFGSREEKERVAELEQDLEEAILEAAAGELDGDEFGQGECVLYMYGPDADRLFSTVEPILRASPLTELGYAIKRYGEPTDMEAREEVVRFR